MKKKKLFLLLVLLLAFSLLLQGCTTGAKFCLSGVLMPVLSGQTQRAEYTPDGSFVRPAETLSAPILFGDIVYERPDAQALCSGFRRVQKLAERGAGSAAILQAYYPVERDYIYFNTMEEYAYIRYTLDLNDPYFAEEYSWLEEQAPLVEQAQELCILAMAASPACAELERLYFGEGFFSEGEVEAIYTNDRVVELLQREAELEIEYMAMRSDMTVELDGEERFVEELLSDPESFDPVTVYTLYYDKYTPMAAELYAELIGVRRQIAEELGYESYADFAYSYYYYRDYTPEQAAQYTAEIAQEMALLYDLAVRNTGGMSASYSPERTMESLAQTAAYLGGEFAAAYDYMMAYGLYDISASGSKMPGSYVTYLSSYEMPFLYVSPTGSASDYLTATHEFGHFVDDYVNYNTTFAIDCAEIFSQGLEFLSLSSPALNPVEQRRMAKAKVSDAVDVFLQQACYAEFERRAYELPVQELTAEKLNALMVECMKEFGVFYYSMEAYLAPSWMDVHHFFIAPFYVISYCVSNDAALQIYQRELENGGGLALYRELLAISPDNSILALLDEAGMQSPFAEGHVSALADFLLAQLK